MKKIHEFKYGGNSFIITKDTINYPNETYDKNCYRVHVLGKDSLQNPCWTQVLCTHPESKGWTEAVIHAIVAEIGKLKNVTPEEGKMTPKELAREIISLNLPLTEEEWEGLMQLFERISPGITCSLEIAVEQPKEGE